MRSIPSLLVAGLLCAVSAAAQGTPPPSAPAQGGRGAGRGGAAQGPQVVSPQVNADRTVTLRLLAPKADEVTITGEILNGASPQAMTKDAEGVWTATLGPLPPDIYTYAFSVDGVSTPDPRGARPRI